MDLPTKGWTVNLCLTNSLGTYWHYLCMIQNSSCIKNGMVRPSRFYVMVRLALDIVCFFVFIYMYNLV